MPNDLDKLAWDFFREFARLEYAVKAAGLRGDERGFVEANWQAFADAVAKVFDAPNGELAAAIEYLRKLPPKKQAIDGNRLAWVDWKPGGKSKAANMLLYVHQIRNNLFHGSKYYGGRWDMPERSATLMRHGLTVLRACLAAAPKAVRDSYEMGGPLDPMQS